MHLESGPFPLLPDPDQAFSVWRTGYGILEVARLHACAPQGALYVCHDAELRLLAVRGVDQSALDLITEVWPERRNDFTQGRPWGIDEPPTVVLACADGHGVAGLVLLRWPARTRPRAIADLRPLSQVLATLLRRLRGDMDESAVEAHAVHNDGAAPTSALHLRVLLDENEWNIARVARLLGITRATIYNRLRRQGVERKRVPKSTRRLVDAHIVNLIAEPISTDERIGPAPAEHPASAAEHTEVVPDEQVPVPTEA